MAIASLVMGFASFVAFPLCCCISPILAILAIVFACVARAKNNRKMPGLAIAGMILGILFLVIMIVCLVAVWAAILRDPVDFLDKVYLEAFDMTYQEYIDQYGNEAFQFIYSKF
jgi:hypothetical protein